MTTASSALRSFTKEERWKLATTKMQSVRTRPSTVAAAEFFANRPERPKDEWKSLPQRLERLCSVLEEWIADEDSMDLSCRFSDNQRESKRLAITAAIMAVATPSFLPSFQKLFTFSLEARQDDAMMVDENHLDLFQNLRILGWIRRDGLLNQPLGEALHRTILAKVRTTIGGEFEDDSLFQHVQEWKDSVVEPWLRDLVGMEVYEQDNWSERLGFCAAECYCLVRMEEIFNVVAEYPDSHPAVVELRTVLERTNMHSQLGDALKTSLNRRLNHPGANTVQILDVYINTIKVLREIDPSDRLLLAVAEPVRSYLRRRADTVRCIITSLTDAEVGGDLYEELRRQDARPLEHAKYDSDDDEEEPDFDWQPPPPISKTKETVFGTYSSSGGGADILSILVSIYGSKELFVNEYRMMLADKLLANLDFNTDKEVHTLELLKLRFGELSMRNCEIMIKDTDDSKRVVSNIHSTLRSMRNDSEPCVDAAIISDIFWPALQKEQLKHHPRIQAELDQFSTEYARLKNPRRLIWLNQLGTVQLELDVIEEGEDGTPVTETREFSCSPLLATLISHFEDKDQWTAEELSNETGIPEHVIQKRMGYWINNRVVKLIPSRGIYELASRDHWLAGEHDLGSGVASLMDEDGSEGQAVSLAAQEEEEMEVFESYIVGMLTNLGQLPTHRIHNMLKTFVAGSDVKYNKTPQQLSIFLQHLCKQEKLECGPDGMYKLLKK